MRSRDSYVVALWILAAVGGCRKAEPPPPAPPAVDLTAAHAPAGALWLDQLDLSSMTTEFGRGTPGKSVTGNPIRIGGKRYPHGVGTHADSELNIDLGGQALWFLADVGVDDELACVDTGDGANKAATRFQVLVDGKPAGEQRVSAGEGARRLAVNIAGAKRLTLLALRDKSRFNHVDWGGALLVMKPGATARPATRPAGDAPRGRKVEPLPKERTARLSADEEPLLRGAPLPKNAIRLQDLDWSQASGDTVSLGKTDAGEPIRLGARDYSHGVSIHGDALLAIELGGHGKRFVARVGLNEEQDCGKALSGGGARFVAWIDGRRAFDSDTVHGYDPAVDVDLDLTGAQRLVLDTRIVAVKTRQVWAGAVLLLDDSGEQPRTTRVQTHDDPEIARARPDELGIHGPRLVGTTPSRPFIFRVPATGKPPLRFVARGLPAGLTLDGKHGILSGAVKDAGTHRVEVSVSAGGKTVTRPLYIVAGEDKLALTPPMGWNSWNAWGTDVDADKIRAAADALVATGLHAHGFAYVNVDDAWEGTRDDNGHIRSNEKFPDMKALADHVHALGLKFGIYSSPGPTTCGNYVGSYQHEADDARTFAAWGVDYLKHDWCSYGTVSKGSNRAEAMAPYQLMSKALESTSRDILLSLCQYGMQSVWQWGKQAGGHLWRTTGDIVDTWNSVETIGFAQADITEHGGPGGWNDPDMLVVGHVGWSRNLHPTRLSKTEQITHVTLWSLLAAPLLLGNDLGKLDDFTLALLSNDEVLDIDQDPLGRPARRVRDEDGAEVWTRPLFDGTLAVALFNRSPVPKDIAVSFSTLGLASRLPVRDLWVRKDLGEAEALKETVPVHGARLFKVGTPRPELWTPDAPALATP